MTEIILRERVISIKAGDTFDQALQGNVLRVTAGGVPLRVQSRTGQLDFTLQAGERAEFPSENEALILSHNSGVAQVFTIQVGKGVNVASALVSGTVTITGTPTVINGGGTLTSITNAVKIVDDGLAYGASYKSITPLVANTPDVIIAPAANVNGAVIHTAAIYSFTSGVFTNPSIIAKASAPTSVIDGDVILSTMVVNNGANCHLVRPVFVPAGRGVYYMAASNEAYASRSILYTLK